MRSDALSRLDAGSFPKLIHGGGVGIDAEYAADHWNADRLGVPTRRGRASARFDTITQEWLREPVKEWSRFRLATGCSFSTISAGALCISRFSTFLTERHPEVGDETGITRTVLEDYLSWLATGPYSTNTKLLSLSMLRVFLDACRRHDWLGELPHSAVIYEEELPNRDDGLPRFVPEFVMAQLESDASLAQLPSPTARHLVVLMMETGLRIGDACTLVFNPIIDDSAGGPCLSFHNLKIRADQLIPLSAKAADAIRTQQDHDRSCWPNGTPWLFPGIVDNADGSKPYNVATLTAQLRRWQRAIDLRDEADVSVRVTSHRFRHTLGTRLINSDVPQHVVQKLLGHASPEMTAHYAVTYPRPHCPRRLRSLSAAAGQHRRRVPPIRPRGPDRHCRVGQAQPFSRPRQPPQRLLRATAPTGVPAPQRVPHLPRLPDHAQVPQRAP